MIKSNSLLSLSISKASTLFSTLGVMSGLSGSYADISASAQINGDLICLGYKTNLKTLAVLPELSYGILAVAPGADADMSAYEPLNPDMTPNVENKVLALEIDRESSEFDFIIKGFTSDSAYYEVPIVMCAYVTDGEKVDYLCLDELNNIAQKEYASSITFKFIAEECFSQK